MQYLPSLMIVFFATFTGQAYGIFSGQLLIGKQDSKFGSTKFSGNRTDLSAYVDPIPLMPIAFGLNISNSKLKAGGLEATGLVISPEVYAWFPIGSIKPYGKLGVVASGKYKMDIDVLGTLVPVTYTASGTYLSIGVLYSLVPLVAILAEYNSMISGELNPDIAGAGKIDLTGSSLLVGVEVGI